MKKDKKKELKIKIKQQKKVESPPDFITPATRGLIPYVLITVLAFMLYNHTFNYSIDKLDEDYIIKNNLPFLSNIDNFKESMRRDAFMRPKGEAFYRPLQNASYVIDASYGPKDKDGIPTPKGFRLSSLLMHIIICSLLFFLLTKLNLHKSASLLVSLIYCCHPLFVHTIVWLPSRGDILLTLFTLAGLITFIYYLEKGNVLFLLANLAFTGLGIFSKESGILIPALYAGYLFFTDRKRLFKPTMLLIYGLYIGIIAIYFYYRTSFIVTEESPQTLGIRPFLYNLPTIPETIGKLFVPYYLSVMPRFTGAVTFIGMVCIGLLTWLYIKNKKSLSAPLMLTGIGWFILFSFPAMIYRHFYGVNSYDYIESRAYLPLIGIIIFLLSAESLQKSKIFLYTLLILIPVFLFIGYRRTAIYKDGITFYKQAIATNPHSAMAYYNMGNIKYYEKDYKAAAAVYNKALELFPGYPDAYNNLGSAIGSMGDYKTAIEKYDMAIKLKSNYADAYMNRGTLYYMQGNYQQALNDLDLAIKYNPLSPEAHYNRGLSKLFLNRKNEACADWMQSKRLGMARADEALKAYCGK